jgi:hypothetical protein
MWGRIVKEMEKGKELDNALKKYVWGKLFSFDGDEYANFCFACEWKKRECEIIGGGENCKKYCLLEYNGDYCLGGLYDIACGIGSQRIEAAREIRDLPMKERWKCGKVLQ